MRWALWPPTSVSNDALQTPLLSRVRPGLLRPGPRINPSEPWLTLFQDISNIEYNYIYTHHSNQMYMIKSNGGSGTVTGLSFNNFMGHSNAYSLDFDTAWSSMDASDGDGISYSNISFSGWTGTCEDGQQRGPVKIDCPEAVVCTDITVEDFNVWTDTDDDSVLYVCENAYGSGACLVSDGDSAYTTTQTVTSSGDYTYTTMDNELSTGYDISSSIPIPTMPASFYPGRSPLSAILNGDASAATATGSGSSAAATTGVAAAAVAGSSSSDSYSATPTSSSSAQPSSGGWGSNSGWGSHSGSGSPFGGSSFWSHNDIAEPATTPAPRAAAGKRSAKFRL